MMYYVITSFLQIISIVLVANAEECIPHSFHRLCLKDKGSTITLENEKLSLTISKTRATITNLYYNSTREPKKYKINLLRGGSAYYLGNINIKNESLVAVPKNTTYKIVRNTDSHIDIQLLCNDPQHWPVELEMHIVLEKRASMFYYYSVHRYTKDMPDGYTAAQLRWALRTNNQVFKYYNNDGKRAGKFPSIKSRIEIYDSSYLLEDGSVYSKYQHASNNEETSGVFGVFDEHLGLSLIQPNEEWISGGPFKQDLTTHPNGNGIMVLFHEHSSHYGTPAMNPPKGWSKVFGPVAFYLNEGTDYRAMYDDARLKLEEEKKKWPYQWVTAKEYDAGGRGSVSGTLYVTDGTKPEWIYFILTEPHVENPGLETLTYMYATKSGPDGKFLIPAVRPGTYKLQVIAKGVVGKFVHNNIAVEAKYNTDLRSIHWKPETHGHTIFQIGIPDHTSAEFYSPVGFPSPIPNLEEYRNYGTWLSYSKEFPEDIDFTVGKSDPSKHWCYFMPMIKTPGSAENLKLVNVTQNSNPTKWKVRFGYNGSGRGNASLTMGFAAAVKAGVRAVMNGIEIFKIKRFEGPTGDSSLFRQAAHGIFRQYCASFSTSLLKHGENVLEFTPPDGVSAENSDCMIMWDFLRLEAHE